MGYHGHFQKKKREHAADGCAIFYQTCRFTLIDVQAFAYNERIPADMPEDLRARLSPFSNIALVCIFQNRQSRSQKVRMVTTHLHWDPAFADIKLLQASLLIEWLESTNATIPTVIAGDFNSKPGEPVMDYLVRGKVCLSKPKTEHPGESGGEAVPVGPDPAIAKAVASARSTSPVLMDNLSVAEIESEDAKNRMNAFAIQRQGVKLASAYNTRDLPFTNKTPDFEGVIDHILYSSGTLSIRDVLCDVYIPELVSASASPTEGMSPPTASSSVPFLGDEKLSSAIPSEHLHIAQYGMSSYLTRLPSLPSRRFPSDHVSLCAWLKWKTVPVLSGAQKPHQGGSSFGVNKKMSARVHGSEAAGRGLSQSVPASTTSWVSLEDFHRNQGVPAHRGQGGRSSNANNKGNEHKSSRKQLYNPSAHKDLDSMGMSGLSLDPTQVYPGSYNPQQQGQFTYQPQHQGVPHGQQGRRRGSNASATSNPGLTHQGSYPSTAQGFFQQHPQQQHQQQQGHPHASHKKF